MRWPGRTIWDTKIQGVCGIVSASDGGTIHTFFSATFAQVTLSPARIIVNPNRTYGIEPAMERTGRFSITVMPASKHRDVHRFIQLRRRQSNKAQIAGLVVRQDHHRIPFIAGGLETVFCEVEQAIDSGDRRLYIAKILEMRRNPAIADERPLLFADVAFPSLRVLGLWRGFRRLAAALGILDLLKSSWYRLKAPAPPDIAGNTYSEAGATEEEIREINQYGVVDRRAIVPPAAPAVLKKKVGVCVVGTGWGAFHCRLLRQVNPGAELFVCGRNEARTARIAKVYNARGCFSSLERAVSDSRVQALTVALPPDLHRWAAEAIAAAGKHALVEKPIAANLADADAMIDAAKRASTILMIAEDMHFRPAIREAWRQISEGNLGEPLYFLSHAATIHRVDRKSAGTVRVGGVLLDMGVHYIRAMRLLMGEPGSVAASRAMQIDIHSGGEDSIQLLFSTPSGWQAHMLFSWSTLRGVLPDIVVAGDEGTLHLWPQASYIDLYPANGTLIKRALTFVRPYALQEKLMLPRFERIRIRVPEREGSGYLGEFREFLGAVVEERDVVSPPIDARRDLEVVLRAYDSLTSRGEAAIAPLP